MNHRKEDLAVAARRCAPVLEVDLLRGLVVQNDHVAQDLDELAVRRHADKDAWRRKEEGRCCALLDGLVLNLDDRRQVGVPNDDVLKVSQTFIALNALFLVNLDFRKNEMVQGDSYEKPSTYDLMTRL